MQTEVNENNHNITSIVRNTLVVILFIVAIFLLYKDYLYNNKKTQTILPDAQVSVLTVKAISEQTPYTNIDAQIPHFKNASIEFNKKIENSITELIQEHKKEAEENWKARLETALPGQDLPQTPTDPIDRLYFYSKFDTPAQNNDSYISVLVRFGGYTGGAHPYEEVISFNYDVKNKREIVLADIFIDNPQYLSVISDFSRTELMNRFTKNLKENFDSPKDQEEYIKTIIEPMLFDGTDPNKPENFRNFTFNEKEITFHFSQYQVGPYVLGLQDVTMPR